MRNAENWRPSKFERRGASLRASRQTGALAPASRLVADRVARFYAKHMSEYARGRLGESGSGEVPLYDTYRHLVTGVVCIDWTKSAHSSRHVDVHCDLARPLPLADGVFDTLIAADVLEHIRDPRLLWTEAARILAPGGVLLANVPFYYWVHEAPHDYFRFTEFALRMFAEDAGLHVRLLEPTGGLPEVLLDLVGKLVVDAPVVGSTLAAAIQTLGGWLTSRRPGRTLSERGARLFPLGYFIVAAEPLKP